MGNEKNIEIERKFLIDLSKINLESCRNVHIRQGYLCFEEDREVRIREMDGKYYMTYKKGGGKVRDEIEFEISERIFTNLWSQTEGRNLEKIRHYFNYESYTVEIDLYLGHLKGFAVAEIEFDSEEECNDFKLPDFFVKDISGFSVYRNRNLIFNGIPADWKND